ncbi:hypothetical protein IMSHALPRED_002613 [Imshaugia aleurites]|uniref:NAD-dependent epimerase/dehydratase domain-containing protein n=1 Tax=Imshaugia aleurites TaxID=172621 RepID=A0A8H3F1S9_9LECA|nr:hypothetical protein IMSHALPRED_002613 [Imshaugia aleurites]
MADYKSQSVMGSQEGLKFNCIITGAGGFVGQALAASLLADPLVSKLTLTDVFEPDVPQTKSRSSVETRCLEADLTSLETCQSLFTPDINLIYLLHGIMSGAAEANLELGLQVNIDSTRQILDILRQTNPGVKVIYPSSLAVYGPPATPTTRITELNAPVPGSSYGAQKHICETLLDDYSRRGLLDGRICRLPTVTVRPGKPTGAASSFASGIFREPLKREKSILPVSTDLEIWICSPRTVVKNLIIARDIPKENFPGTRIVNIPGVTVTIREMLDALKAVAGDEALKLVEEKRDKATEKIVLSWPTRLDISRAKALGFAEDGTLANTIKEYIDDYGTKTS